MREKVRLFLSILRRCAGSRGFTLLEVTIALAIVGLLLAILTSTLSLTLTQVPKEGAKLAVENRHQLARYWFTRDANSAESFTPGTSPNYGSFTWRDFSGEATTTYAVTYSYDATLDALMREEKRNGVFQDSFQVAADVLQESDVSFTWSPGQRKVAVTIMPTVQEAVAIGDVSRTASLVAFLRYEAEGPVSPPGDAPVSPPPPGSETYYVAAAPTVLTGTYVSGNAASLQNADTDYYTVGSASVGGGSQMVSWSAASQSMSAPTTINQVEVRFTGKVNRRDVSTNLYVKDASGWSDIADSGFTFTEANVEKTHSLLLDAAKVSYINTARVVELKVEATTGATFTLYSNQVLFIVSP